MKTPPTDSLQRRYERIKHTLNEPARRLWAGTEAERLGPGGIAAVARATGMSPSTVAKGVRELHTGAPDLTGRQRRQGGGRKKLTQTHPGLGERLEALVEPFASGGPAGPLCWTCNSNARLAAELSRQDHPVSADTVGRLLKAQGYRLQTKRTRSGSEMDGERDAQFRYIAAAVAAFNSRGSPVIAVDARKKQLVGGDGHAAWAWRPRSRPAGAGASGRGDADPRGGIPDGIYDLYPGGGWTTLAADCDTVEFAVTSIAGWWLRMGEPAHPQARDILIVADGAGGNGAPYRLWQKRLQGWADSQRLAIVVCHFPPGASKWNTVAHRMFCDSVSNWPGQPLVSHQLVISLIGMSRAPGKAAPGGASRPAPGASQNGRQVSNRELAQLAIERADFHGEWNYCITPRSK